MDLQLLLNSSRVTIGYAGTLTIDGVDLYDAGNYSVYLSNVGGSQTANFTINVLLCKS